MTKETKSLIAMVAGLILLGMSFAWSHSSSPPRTWTEADAEEYIKTGAKLHDMTFQVRRDGQTSADGSKQVSPEEFEAQKQAWAVQQDELDAARFGRRRTSWVMFGLGLLITFGGFAAYKSGD